MLKVKSKAYKLLPLLLLTSTCWAGLNQTYPSSPVTFLRMEAYTDAISTASEDMYSLETDTWTVGTTNYIFIPSNQTIRMFQYDFTESTPSVVEADMNISDFITYIGEKAKLQAFNKMMDGSEEEYMVWGDTVNYPSPGEWGGWCLVFVNGKWISGSCP